MAWGPNPPDEHVVEAIHTGLDAGMTWVDTAEVYGGGRSEELVARALEGGDDVMVFTKVAPKPSGSGFDADGVRRGAEASLKRLGRDVLDLYQLHWPDHTTPVEETWEAMAALVEEGLVRWIGVSNFSKTLIQRCEDIRHVDSLQSEFSMLRRKGATDLFPWCRENGTGFLAYGPLAYGLLTGAITAETRFGDDDWRSGRHGMGYYRDLFAPDVIGDKLAVVDALRPIADRLGISPAQLALAWVVHPDWAAAAIAGSRSPAHTRDNAAAGSVQLTAKDVEEIDSILQ